MVKMGTYINPESIVPQKGRKVDLKDTFADTSAQLRDGEKLCAHATGPGPTGKIAIVIMHHGDYDAVKGSPDRFLGLYAIGPEVLAHAR
jgi:hypothetical protein